MKSIHPDRLSEPRELVSLLSGSGFPAGPCAGVDRIVLDPPAGAIPAIRGEIDPDRAGSQRRSVSRARFLESLMGRGGTGPVTPGAGGYRRRA
jgi:hypothetical protein